MAVATTAAAILITALLVFLLSRAKKLILRTVSSSIFEAAFHWLQRRRRGNGRGRLQVFVALDDPHSFLLLQGLKRFRGRYDIEMHMHLIASGTHMFATSPAKEMYWKAKDAAMLCELYGFRCPGAWRVDESTGNSDTSDDLADSYRKNVERVLSLGNDGNIALQEGDDTQLDQLINIFEQWWTKVQHLDDLNALNDVDTPPAMLASRELLEKLKHYGTAMVLFEGEWYWSVSRLYHLEVRLRKEAHWQAGSQQYLFDKEYEKLVPGRKLKSTNKEVLELFYSFRSPYSQIIVRRAKKLAQHYGVPLVIRPIMPMLMRGLPVSKTKSRYIYFDTVREARLRHHTPFGEVNDPLGDAVRNAMGVFVYARAQAKEADYVEIFADEVWGRFSGFLKAHDIKRIAKLSGLSPDEAIEATKNDDFKALWQKEVTDNEAFLNENGLWGVPCMRFGNLIVWGQDRLWRIEQAILEQCQ